MIDLSGKNGKLIIHKGDPRLPDRDFSPVCAVCGAVATHVVQTSMSNTRLDRGGNLSRFQGWLRTNYCSKHGGAA